jgi:hypothetical protein
MKKYQFLFILIITTALYACRQPNIIGYWKTTNADTSIVKPGSKQGDLVINADSTFTWFGPDDNNDNNPTPGWHMGDRTGIWTIRNSDTLYLFDDQYKSMLPKKWVDEYGVLLGAKYKIVKHSKKQLTLSFKRDVYLDTIILKDTTILMEFMRK